MVLVSLLNGSGERRSPPLLLSPPARRSGTRPLGAVRAPGSAPGVQAQVLGIPRAPAAGDPAAGRPLGEQEEAPVTPHAMCLFHEALDSSSDEQGGCATTGEGCAATTKRGRRCHCLPALRGEGGAAASPPPGHGPPPPRTPSQSPPPTPPSDEVHESSSSDSTDEDEEAREKETRTRTATSRGGRGRPSSRATAPLGHPFVSMLRCL